MVDWIEPFFLWNINEQVVFATLSHINFFRNVTKNGVSSEQCDKGFHSSWVLVSPIIFIDYWVWGLWFFLGTQRYCPVLVLSKGHWCLSFYFFLLPSKEVLSFLEWFGGVCPISLVLVTVIPIQFIPSIMNELDGGVDIVYEEVIAGWFLSPWFGLSWFVPKGLCSQDFFWKVWYFP